METMTEMGKEAKTDTGTESNIETKIDTDTENMTLGQRLTLPQ